MSTELIEITCPCGETKIKADMPPIGAGICHCNEDRKMTQGIAMEGVLWPPSGHITTTKGSLVSRKRPDMNITVHSCSECAIMMYHTEKSGLDIITTCEIQRCYGKDNMPAGCENQAHHWYSERVVDIDDNLVKWYDGPKEFGGSGRKCRNDGSIIEEESS